MYLSHQFKAFDTDVFIGIVTDKNTTKTILNKIEKDAKSFEKKFSRFDSSSELNKLNNANGKKIKVSIEMIDLLKKSKIAYKNTDGLFDPTVLVSLQKIGYDKSFKATSPVTKNPKTTKNLATTIKTNFQKRTKFDALKITKNTITIPKGLVLDLGGIAKGYWVDKITKILAKQYKNFWISAGGDVYLKGTKEDGKLWEIGVQNPAIFDQDILTLKTPKKGIGIATSGIAKRHGIKDGIKWHHLINSKTGLPVDNSILAVTAIANSTMAADVMAKTTLMLGIKKGLALINSMRDYGCIIIDNDLKIYTSKEIKKFL
jgi:thiamine biosynthesis lipoprotein